MGKEKFVDSRYCYAVVGASANPEKFGYKVLKYLLDAGFEAIPINPRGGEILEQKVYTRLNDVPRRIDVAVFVVPPAVAEKVIGEAAESGIKKIWLQPGSESEAAADICAAHGLACSQGACIMLPS